MKQQVGKQPRSHRGQSSVLDVKQICLLEPLNDAEFAFAASWTAGSKWSDEPISLCGFVMPPGSKVVQRLSENGVWGKRCFRIGIAGLRKDILDECVKVTPLPTLLLTRLAWMKVSSGGFQTVHPEPRGCGEEGAG